MTQRPASLYTRTGDTGSTGLSGDKRVNKDTIRVQALGDVDELNCHIGLVRSLCNEEPMKGFLKEIQNLLFEMGAELAKPGANRLLPPHTARLEQFIDRLDDALPPLSNFVLPGGCPAGAQCHLARAVCRRAERNLFRLSRTEQVNVSSLKFVNRLSDLLFVVARTLNHRAGSPEDAWKGTTGKNEQ
jgi:cob(I)alamin adenosyltransferase